ncbi:MAG: ATP-binding cassette domain-containing protein, partial [Desulfuromonadales bacterium]|nr:ATP-binding cassette domain-containing protein [Desulfuromonadales bacterium]
MNEYKPLLTVENIFLSFGGVHALREVSFEVRPGELFSIIGPNGAGKTSMLNCISGRYQPQKGQIVFKDQSIVGMKPNDRCQLGIGRTFQNLAL